MESMTPAAGPSLDQGSNLVTTKAVGERERRKMLALRGNSALKGNCLEPMETNRVAINYRYCMYSYGRRRTVVPHVFSSLLRVPEMETR